MKTIKTTLFLSLLLMFAVSAFGQKGTVFDNDENPDARRVSSQRLDSLSEQLARQGEELAENAYRNYTNNRNNRRNDLDAVFAAEQFNASADLFYKMVRDRRNSSDLRQAYSVLQNLYQRSTNNSNRNDWNNIQRTLNDISRELGGNYNGGGNGNGNGDGGYTGNGQFNWRGTVDDRVQLVISDDYLEERTLGGTEYNNSNYNFTSRLPRRNTNVSVTKRRGRGDVRVVQQPSRNNNYTAIIEIRDSSGGANDYEIEVRW